MTWREGGEALTKANHNTTHLQQAQLSSDQMKFRKTAGLSDEDAVYLIKSVVGGLHICKRV